ncbi:hypothetical protein Cs7R123_62810 [Catellatospora sp. TT07R-123]|nr:hypothetical protein Cs7R123_62810 [Catellatospora sp. TT07R-123]
MRSSEEHARQWAQIEQCAWEYKDAWFRDDRPAAARARDAYRQIMRTTTGSDWYLRTLAIFEMARTAGVFGDIDWLIDDLLSRHRLIDTGDLEDDNDRRTTARNFVSLCADVLESEAAVDHPREDELTEAMRDIARRSESVLTDHHHRGFQRVAEIRAFRRSRAAIAQTRRSVAAAFDGLPPVSWAPPLGQRQRSPAAVDPRGLVGVFGLNLWLAFRLADDALETAETHGDLAPLDDLIDRLQRAGICPGLTHLVRARRHVVAGDLPAALGELDAGVRADDFTARRLRPQLHASYGMLLARLDPDRLDDGIESCRDGRRAALRWWRRTTAADAGLARLLLWRAGQQPEPSAQQAADIREAARLIGRRCRIWHIHGADDRLLLHEVRAARDAVTGRGNPQRRHRQWRDAVGARWTTAARARLAAAWAEWALGTDVAECAAEAYESLVNLAAQDAAERYGTGAKQRILAAAQEHAEEAGYWLARTGHYREAVLALETGRAVGLTELLGRDDPALFDQLDRAGRGDLAGAYRKALAVYAEHEHAQSAGLGQAWTQVRAAARLVARATGADPLGIGARYEDVIAETGEGALVYLGAAKAGGYALVVAAQHDPQYVDLPKLDRGSVARIIGRIRPQVEPSTGLARLPDREVRPIGPVYEDPMADGLRTLWMDGIRDLVRFSARGRIITFVPVGLFNLLPLHAAGDPGLPGDRHTEWQHAGNFSAVRYAPNARGLRRCRDTAAELADGEQTLLAVDVPDGRGLAAGARLRFVARETVEVTRRWTGRAVRPVHGCTWEEFVTNADRYTVWHLACHGSSRPEAISDTRLYFADRQVTLTELQEALRPGLRRLAVLSACQTNMTGSALPNEVIGLPTALLRLGFAGVIATAWAVDDLATTYLMAAFYERWCRDGQPPAVALNQAQHWLRTATRDDLAALLPGIDPPGGSSPWPYADPRYWAAFAYTGA